MKPGNHDTFPKLLVRNQEAWSDQVAMRKKDFGIWREHTWNDCLINVKYLCLYFIGLGLNPGDRVGIIGENEPEWFWAEFAVQAAGGTMVGIYTDMTPPQVEFMVNHSGQHLL